MRRYIVLRAMSMFLRVVGWLMLIGALVCLFLVGAVAQMFQSVVSSEFAGAIKTASVIYYLAGAAMLLFNGLLAVVIGHSVGVFVDIAQKASLLPEIANDSAKMVSVFSYIREGADRARQSHLSVS